MPTSTRFIRALRRLPVDRTPVWLMRQAGRYLPEYRALREKAGSFLTLCQTPELACEVTLQPLRRFPLDAAIIFSDILTVPQAMGMQLVFTEGEGPSFPSPLRTEKDIARLILPEPDKLDYVAQAIKLVKPELVSSKSKTPLIGFCGSPWTVATYMIEGGHSKHFTHVKKWILESPESFNRLLDKLVKASTDYLSAQITAGADCVMIFDTWGGILDKPRYQAFSLAPMQQMVKAISAIHPEIPIILFTKGGGQWLSDMAQTGCTALGLDWTMDIGDARNIAGVGDKVALQGNMDPSILYASPAVIQAEVGRILARFGQGSGHVMNLGHGILPDMDYHHIEAFIQAVIEQSSVYHR